MPYQPIAANAQGKPQPKISPFNPMGGGNANPAYLQTMTSAVGGGSHPVVTPKSSVVPGEVAPQGQPTQLSDTGASNPQVLPGSSPPGGPPITPRRPSDAGGMIGQHGPGLPQTGTGTGQGQNLNDLYNFFKTDLQNEQKKELASTTSDAAARGVYYGTPLTGSTADINTQYLRGLGQLQAGMYGNEQQAYLTRLAIAAGLIPPGSLGETGNNDIFSWLGMLGSPTATAQPNQPPVTPKNQPPVTPKLPKQG